MKLYTLKHQQLIRRSLTEVFEFFERPENLAKLTPVQLGFEILTPTPIEMKSGVLIDYTIKLFGIRLRWTTLITAFDPPNSFVDQQLKGPYSFWHHTHTFRQTIEGTIITDEVRYVLPFGLLGRMAHALFIGRQLKRIFGYRAEYIENYFAGETQHTQIEVKQ
jgi:ligand-binding SRPBCC domain-containing protein